MSDQDLVVATVRDVLAKHEPFALTADTMWDGGLWADLAEAGLTGVGLPEEAGGSGGELADAVAVVRTLAAGAGAVPVAEQLLAAGPVLLAADLDLPDPAEPLTLAVAGAVTAEPSDDGDGPGRWTLTGTATKHNNAGVRRLFLARHPEASLYAGFADFAFYRFEIASGHLVAGFGRIVDLAPAELLDPSVDDS